MKRLILLAALLLSSCKSAKPELISLLSQSPGQGQLPSVGQKGSGRMVSGSDPATSATVSYKIQSRVAITPSENYGSTAHYIVRGHLGL
jgi:hypothetical protein